MMKKLSRTRKVWALRFQRPSIFGLDSIWLEGMPDHPCRTLLFETRRAARAYLAPQQAEERKRTDGWTWWRCAKPVRVRVTVEEI